MTRFAGDAVALEGADQAARLLRKYRAAGEADTGPIAKHPAALAEAESIAAWARAEIAKATEACDRLELVVNQP